MKSCGCGFGALSLSAPSITGLKQAAPITTTTQGTYAAPPVDMAAIGKTLLGSKTSLTATIGQPKPVFSFAPAGAVIVNKTLRLASSARPSDVPGVIRQGSGSGAAAGPANAATFAADCQAQGGTLQPDGSRQLCRLVDGSLFDETYNCATGVVQGGACAQQQGGGDGGTGGAKTNTALMLGGAALLALALLRR